MNPLEKIIAALKKKVAPAPKPAPTPAPVRQSFATQKQSIAPPIPMPAPTPQRQTMAQPRQVINTKVTKTAAKPNIIQKGISNLKGNIKNFQDDDFKMYGPKVVGEQVTNLLSSKNKTPFKTPTDYAQNFVANAAGGLTEAGVASVTVPRSKKATTMEKVGAFAGGIGAITAPVQSTQIGVLTSAIKKALNRDKPVDMRSDIAAGTKTAGVLRATGPIVSKVLGKFGSRLPSNSLVATGGQKVASSALNVAEGLVIDKTTGMPTTPTSVAIDAVTGLTGTGNVRAGNIKGIDVSNAKGVKQNTLDMGDVEEIGNIYRRMSTNWTRNGKPDLDQLTKDSNLVDLILKDKYGADAKDMKRPIQDKIETLFKIAQDESGILRRGGVKMGIKGVDDTTDPLIQEARKYKSAEEFISSYQGSATQYGEYNPTIRSGGTPGSKRLTNLGIKPDLEVTIYRGIDDIKGDLPRKINDGDFVTTDYDSARAYAGSDKDVVSMKVKAKDLFADDPNEFASEPFYKGSEYVYSKAQEKTAELTKSQLTDIWNKAQETAQTKTTAPSGPMMGFVSNSGISQTSKDSANIAGDGARVATADKNSIPGQVGTIKGTPQIGGKQKADSQKVPSSKGTPTGNPIQDDITGVNPSGIVTKIREAVQDSWVRVKKLQQQEGVKIKQGANPYQAEELFHGRIGTRLESVKETVKSLDKDILDTSKRIGVPDTQLSKDVNRYLQALHAPERNRIHGDGAAGMTTKEARTILKEIGGGKNAKEVRRIAQQVSDMNKKTLNILLEGQVIGKDTYDTLTKQYKNHVPLNRIMDDTDNVGDVLAGKGFNVKGSGIKRAKGSDKEVSDIVTNVVANVEAALVRAEKNRVNLETLNFSRNNKQLGIFKEIRPKAIGKDFNGNMLMQQITDPNVLHIRENGKPVYLHIADEKLAKVFQGIGQEKLPGAFKFINTFTRFYSGLHTRFNPEFALSNVIRDSQEMAVYMASQKDIGFKGAGKAIADIPSSQRAVIDAIRGVDSEGARLYKQMQMDGGTTGGMGLSTRKQVELDINEIRKLNRSNPRRAAEKILEGFDKWNTVFEDGTRFSVYKRALDSGLTREQAASMAKNATVNFNRKGTAGPIINALYMFSNASIQGSAKMLRAMKNPKVAAATVTAVGGSVAAVNNWNDSIDPKWRDKVTEWDRNSNMVVMLPSDSGDAKYITIPVSWGLKPIKVGAEVAYDLATGHEKNIGDGAVKIASAAFDAYNPAGGEDMFSTITPTVLDTPSEIVRNKSWSGGMIRPDWLSGLPASEQHFKDFGKTPSEKVAKIITDTLAKGGIQISPQDLLYAYQAYIGGVGKSATRFASTATSLATGQAPEVRDVPFVNRFIKNRSAEQVEASVKGAEKKDFKESLKRYKTGSNEQKDAIRSYLRTLPDDEARKGALYGLSQDGIPTKGITTSSKIDAIDAYLNGDEELAAQLQAKYGLVVKQADIKNRVAEYKRNAIDAYLDGSEEQAAQIQGKYGIEVNRADVAKRAKSRAIAAYKKYLSTKDPKYEAEAAKLQSEYGFTVRKSEIE